MKVILPAGNTCWHCEVTTEAGETKTIDTGCTGREKAEEIAKGARVEELERAALTHRLTADVVTLITANRTITVDEAIVEWEEWMKIGVRSDRTRVNNAITAKQWAREMTLGGRSIGSITINDIHPWVNRKCADKRGTRLLKLAAIRNVFRFCSTKRYVLSDPSQLVAIDYKIMSHEQKETRHKLVFDDDEIDYLLANSHGAEPPSITPGFFRAAIILGRDMALRLGDICNLEWACFNFATTSAVIWMDKTNTRIELPLSDRVVHLLTTMDRVDRQFLFPKERSIVNNPDIRSLLSTNFSRFFERLGFEGYSFHSLRATLATSLANQGATLEEIAKALGHKHIKTTQNYVRRPGAATVAMR